MNDIEFSILSQFGVPRGFQSGELVFRKGDASCEMYFIVSGSVDLKFEGDREDKTVGAKEYFGELSFVVGRNYRSATAIAAKPLKLTALDQTAFDRLTELQTHLLFKLMRHSCAYLLESEQELTADLRYRNNQLQETLDNLRHIKAELDFKEIQAQTDELTGLYNRRALNTQLEKYIEWYRHTDNQLGVLMIDLDGFKRVNDSYSHQIGDEVLILVAKLAGEARFAKSCQNT